MKDEEVRHREAIRALLARFVIATDRGRFDELAACFTPSGTTRWPGGGGDGREAIAATLQKNAPNPAITLVRHHLTTMQIDLAPDMLSGTGRIYFFTMTNHGVDHTGTYVDRYVREGAEWLIASREVRIDWQAADSPYLRPVSR